MTVNTQAGVEATKNFTQIIKDNLSKFGFIAFILAIIAGITYFVWRVEDHNAERIKTEGQLRSEIQYINGRMDQFTQYNSNCNNRLYESNFNQN